VEQAVAAQPIGIPAIASAVSRAALVLTGRVDTIGQKDDEDLSFRIEAVLKLGMAKFNPGGRGNDRNIQQTIEQAKNHPHPLMVQAGIAAAGLTKEQMHKLY
jgi:hypothetical protein